MDFLVISQLLTDQYAVKILVATVRSPRCAQDIAKQNGIPIAACYRRIKDLEKFGLVRCTETRLSQQGKHVCYYVSMVKTAHVYYEEGRLKVKLEMKDASFKGTNNGWHDIELDDRKSPPPDEDDIPPENGEKEKKDRK